MYKAVLLTGEEVAIKVQRPNIGPLVKSDLVIFRTLAGLLDPIARQRLGTRRPPADERAPLQHSGGTITASGRWCGSSTSTDTVVTAQMKQGVPSAARQTGVTTGTL